MSEVISAELARRVKLVVLDVDGVLTDGSIYLGQDATGAALELKRFDTMDGLGVKMLQWSGLGVAIVSGRESAATTLRAEELGVEDCYQVAAGHKLPVMTALLERRGVTWGEVACVADDLADLPLLRRAGLPVAVANAAPEVREIAAWTTTRPGGRGAVREFAEALLRARGEWDRLVQEYCDARED